MMSTNWDVVLQVSKTLTINISWSDKAGNGGQLLGCKTQEVGFNRRIDSAKAWLTITGPLIDHVDEP